MTATEGNAEETHVASRPSNHSQLPNWHYEAPNPTRRDEPPDESAFSFPSLDSLERLNLGDYVRTNVSNLDGDGRRYFDFGLRLMFSYQHELAAKCFLACLEESPLCALAHGFISICHAPNYNFKGQPYYESAYHQDDSTKHDLLCVFPSQQVADRHSRMAVEKTEEFRKLRRINVGGNSKRRNKKGKKQSRVMPPQSMPAQESLASDTSTLLPRSLSSSPILPANDDIPVNSNPNNESSNSDCDLAPSVLSDLETQLLSAIRVLTCCPGVDPALSMETVGRPYANALRKIYLKYPDDPEVVYCFAESLMVLNAWQLYEYPSGKPLSPDVEETRNVLERALQQHKNHAGLCHLYVHLSEMSAHPEKALPVCEPLRRMFPDAGHLIHMPTHIDVLVGDYESCVRYNEAAILADLHVMKCSPSSAGRESFYFGYIVHNYHMLVFGAILGGMEAKAMEYARKLNELINEGIFAEHEYMTAYLESYGALDIHVMVRFGRWKELLEVPFPSNKKLMLFRAASIKVGRCLALAVMGNVTEAKKEADRFDTLRTTPGADARILHNNTVARLLAVDAVMLRGEIAYREEKYESAFNLLRKAVEMQDDLNYDEPWGKMQPIRHALAGLLCEQGQVDEAISVFRKDLAFHPKNPFALVGLISALKKKAGSSCCLESGSEFEEEISELEQQLKTQRQSQWADFDVTVPCECCQRP